MSCRFQGGERGTIKPKANFDAKDDAVALRKAIEGLGTNSDIQYNAYLEADVISGHLFHFFTYRK